MKITAIRRFLSFVVCVATLLCCIPFSAQASSITPLPTSAPSATIERTVADPKTLNTWETFFTSTSSRYSGGVYIDKSVYTAQEAKDDAYFADIADSLSFGKDNFSNDNFMVALSALGSNSEVLGYSYLPTDTVLILDASTSMGEGAANSTSIDDMVAGANNAINRLLSLNNYNRVGVVIYNGNSSVLLPLDHYTANNNSGNILEYRRTSSRNRIYIASNVTDGDGNPVDVNYIAQASGTYTQGGIYEAAQLLLDADTVIEDGKIQGGTNRIPIMVLMSDGEPSYRTTTGSNNTINKYHQASNANADRNNFREDEITAFSTMLTAAWAEAEVSAHYGEDTRFYTLGYNLSANHSYALNVLNPLNTNNPLYTNFSRYASTYLALDRNETGNFRNGTNQNAQTLFRVTRQSDPDKVTSLDYVDRYWAASNANLLNSAFDAIVDEIIIQSRYYSTLVSTGNYQQDGFISLTDEIGTFMEVKDIKGIYIGEDKLVSGGMFAEFITTGSVADYDNENYDESQLAGFENEILNAISTRFNISLSNARLLLNSAIDSGFISYSSPDEFSNYVAWYADEENNYLAPYTNASTHANTAKYIVRSYFYMGDVTQNHVTTSMLYTLVRVREDIETGRQIVDMDVPAALLPIITYTITVNGDEFTDENVQGLTSIQKKPISLLFEVGLDSDINKVNLTEKVTDPFRKDANGDYVFYTNRWRDNNGNAFVRPTQPDPHIFYHGIINTTASQFIPSLENQRYYYTENKQILDASHQIYTGAKPAPGETYYVEYKYVEGNANNASLVTVYDEIAPQVLNLQDNIIQIDGKPGWFIAQGTPQFYFGEQVHGEQGHLHKTENLTNTLQFSDYPQIVYHDEEDHHGYHVLNYHGNNGLVRVTPTQGIKLSKTVRQQVENAPDAFEFEITLDGITEQTFSLYVDEGNGIPSTPVPVTTDANGVFSVTLGDGDIAYITDIPAGTTYSVTEKYNPYYTGFGTNTNGTVDAGDYAEVSFENAPKQHGSLLVEKDVTHPFTSISQALADQNFNITVTFTGSADDLAQITPSDSSVQSSDNGRTYSFTLKSGHDILFTNIPANVTYQVTETNIPNGYTLVTDPQTMTGTIRDTQAQVLLVNNYVPAPVSPAITIFGEKDINGRPWDASIDNYQVALQQVVFGGQDAVAIGDPTIVNVAKNELGNDYTIDMRNISYTAPGTYNYVVYEVTPEDANRVPDISYDTSFAVFSITVSDNGSGALFVDEITVHQNTAGIGGDAVNGYFIEKDFTNTYMSTNVNFAVYKNVIDEATGTPIDLHRGGIMFGLYDSTDATAPIYSTLTNEQGIANFTIRTSQSEYATAKSYYLREVLPPTDSQVVGMTYDTTFKYVITIDWSDDTAAAPAITYYHFDSATNTVGAQIDITASPMIITNTYDDYVVSLPVLELGGQKTVNDGSLPIRDTFTFALYETSGDFNIDGLTPIQTKTVDSQTANGRFSFTDVTFTTEGTKYLVLCEQPGTTGGITYDQTQYHITVDVTKVTDNYKTVLAANVLHMHKVGHGDVNASEMNFNNIYRINDTESLNIRGTKTLTGRTLVEGEFTIGLFQPGSTTPLLTALVDKDGNFAFDALELSVNDATNYAETIQYEIREIIPDDPDKKGISYNSDGKVKYDLTVHIYDDGNGGLIKELTVDGQPVTDVNVAFTNAYSATGTTLALSGDKILEGKTDGTFTFELYETTSNFEIAEGSTPVTTNAVVTNGTGNYAFNLNYGGADRGYHYYVLREQLPAQTDGILYDATEYHITVNALDNGHGEMEAHVMSIVSAYSEGSYTNATLNFTNRYQPKSTEYSIAGTKNFNNGTMEADLFEFTLSNDEGEISNVMNSADGSFAFPAVPLETVGDHIFYVSEVNGGQTINRISYDNAVYTITIPVIDDGIGNLYVDETNIAYVRTVGNTTEATTELLFNNTYHHGGGGGGGHHPQPEPTPTPVPGFVSPQTGDTSNMGLWVALMLASGCGIVVIALLGRKNEETTEN